MFWTFLGENSSTFESGAKVVSRVELSLRTIKWLWDGAILAPLYFSVQYARWILSTRKSGTCSALPTMDHM